MKTVLLASFGFYFVCTSFMGCGSSTSNKDAALGGSSGSGGAIVSGGSGGSVADANTAIDLGAGGSGGSTGVDFGAGGNTSPVDSTSPGIDGPPDSSRVDCTGLTPAQCHDRIINPPTLPDGVLPQDPGPNPPVPYPNCAAI